MGSAGQGGLIDWLIGCKIGREIGRLIDWSAVQLTVMFLIRQFYSTKDKKWSEKLIHSAHWDHSPIYAEMGAQLLRARVWAAMYLDRGCLYVLLSS